MASYRIEIKKSAQKEIQSLPTQDLKRVVAKIQQLANNPRMLDSKKLTSQEQYRVRVGQYRILYEIHDAVLVVVIVRVANRREAYR
jgi:mRNA interferase RelE/StbE